MARFDAYGCPNNREEVLANELIKMAVWWVSQLDDTHKDVRSSNYRELTARAELARIAREYREYM